MNAKVIRAWYERYDGEPQLRLTLDGIEPTATVDGEAAKALIERKLHAVFLGADFEDLTSVMRNGRRWPGYTDDPEIVKLAAQFVAGCMNGTFVDGKVLVE